MIDLKTQRAAFLRAIDINGADMIDLIGWAAHTAEQRQNSFVRPKTASLFAADHITLSFMGEVLAKTDHPEIAIYLAACAVQSRQVLVEATVRPDLHYRTHRFSRVADGLHAGLIAAAMEPEDAALWSKLFQQSLSHHGQMALLAGLSHTA